MALVLSDIRSCVLQSNYLNCVRLIFANRPPLSEKEQFEAPYYDYLQVRSARCAAELPQLISAGLWWSCLPTPTGSSATIDG